MDNYKFDYIHVVLAPNLNLAFYQNAVPVLRELAIINEGEESLQGVDWIFRRIPPPKYDGTRHPNMIHSAT